MTGQLEEASFGDGEYAGVWVSDTQPGGGRARRSGHVTQELGEVISCGTVQGSENGDRCPNQHILVTDLVSEPVAFNRGRDGSHGSLAVLCCMS